MAKNTVAIGIRLPIYLLEMYRKLSKKQNESISELIRRASLKLFDQNDVSMQNDLKKCYVKVKRKELHSELYIIKNMYKRILDMAMTNYFMTGNINMRAVNLSLDEYVKEFELYDDKIKKAIGTDFKLTVRRLRNQEFLLGQSDTVKKLKLIEKK